MPSVQSADRLDAAWRENDYLWGRLDAAELILRMLRESRPDVRASTPTSRGQAADQAGPRLQQALRAVLASETDLARVVELRARLQVDVDALPKPEPRAGRRGSGRRPRPGWCR